MDYNFDPEFDRSFIGALPLSSLEDVDAAREGIKSMLGMMNADLDTSRLNIEDRPIPGLNGSPDIVVRIYQAKKGKEDHKVAAGELTGAVLYLHGGGFVVGDIDTEHAGACAYTEALGVPFISVDYRLAPEHPYPAPVDDCYAALLWLHENAAEFNIDPDRIAIFGQSAGAGLAASTVLRANTSGGPAICHQFLGIPELDDRLQTPSMTQFTDTPLWNRPNAEFSWKYYLGEAHTPGSDSVPVEAAPSRANVSDVKGLPPAFITAMEFDPLRDEAIYYALRLLEAGVPVELHVYPGTFHGSSLFTHADVSQRQQRDVLGAIERALA
ncbi:MAG: alpha/beta hydrolase [Pseudomonadales bacterium]